MSRSFNRRELVLGVGAAGMASLWARGASAAEKPAAKKKAAAPITIGYAAITWGDQGVKKAIAEIAGAGYPGVQLRLNIMKEFATPEELKAELAKAKLTFACLSGGGPKSDPAARAAEVEKFVAGARFAKAAGALVVQATSPKRGATVEKAELESFAQTLNEIGKKTAEIGIPLAFHNHMNQLGESPAEVDTILAACDPKYVKLLLDTGHYAAAGGDPVKAIEKHGKRLAMMHIKDVRDKEPKDGGKGYEFVELGQGKVEFKPLFAALKKVGYKGWVVVELDSVPAGRAPKDAAVANKAFLEKTLGLTVG